MPQNVEVKAKVSDPVRLAELICDLTDSLGIILQQEDVFYNSPKGRLKLRILDNNAHGELIYYERSNDKGPKFSEYFVTDVPDVESFKICLGHALGVLGTVKKVRQLYMHNSTRIHLDEVEGLGCFMELEVQLNPNQTAAEGEKIANNLMEKLEINESDLISVAYMDLLLSPSNSVEKLPHHNATPIDNSTSASNNSSPENSSSGLPDG